MIADSGVVEVFKITRKEIAYLNEKQQALVYETIAQEREPDRPDLEQAIKDKQAKFIEWDNDKKARVNKILIDYKIRKYGVMAVKDI